MYKLLMLVMLSLFTINCLFAQEKAIRIFNKRTNKEHIIKENRRIRLKTIEGVKLSGRVQILDHETLIVKDYVVKIDQIQKIKRDPLFATICTKTFCYYSGALTFGASFFLYGYLQDPLIFTLLIPSAGLIYGGIKSPNLLRSYRISRNWEYDIVQLQ